MDISEDIYLIDKPKGMTSRDAVEVFKKRMGAKKAGHAGTLDPQATGLLIVGVDTATKKLKDYVGLDKVYEAQITLGIKTETGDLEGVVKKERLIGKNEVDEKKKKIQVVIESLEGKNILPVPRFSAVKQAGEPLYKKARRGEDFVVPKREMQVNWSRLKNVKYSDGKIYLDVELEVASGVYIRSLAEEVGKRLGLPATLSALRRIKVGKFDIKGGRSLEG